MATSFPGESSPSSVIVTIGKKRGGKNTDTSPGRYIIGASLFGGRSNLSVVGVEMTGVAA
jgi:hypothetical protein